MKKTFTFCALMSLAVTGWSQSGVAKRHMHFPLKNNPEKEWFYKHVQQMLHMQSNQLNAPKSTAIKQRLIAETYFDDQAIISDSITYQYAGNNGSQYDYNYMFYNSGYDYSISPNNYPYDLTRMDIKADTANVWLYDGSTFVLYQKQVASYHSNGIVEEHQSIEGPDIQKTVNSFDALGIHIQTTYLESNDGGDNFDTSAKVLITYTAQNKPATYTAYGYDAGNWNFELKVAFTYDANNNLDSLNIYMDNGGSLQNVVSYVHSYYNNNTLKTVIGYQFDGTTLQPEVKDSFAYNSTDFFTTLIESYPNMVGGWDDTYILSKTLNTQNLPDTFRVLVNDGLNNWIKVAEHSYTYDANGNIITETGYEDNLGSGNLLLLYTAKYYYEDYDDLSSVGEMNGNTAQVRVFPNPAENNLHIEVNEEFTQGVRIQIYNLAGQLMQQVNFSGNTGKTITLPVQDLTPSMYLLQVQNHKGQNLHTQQFIKK